jgi:toxin ParE1/3/4
VEVRIEWSGLSERQLKEIFEYYTINASPGVAGKLIDKIIDSVSILKSNPLIGPKEELLTEYPEDFRYLIVSNYKIIYWKTGSRIMIASVFDCRQNPIKIKKIK